MKKVYMTLRSGATAIMNAENMGDRTNEDYIRAILGGEDEDWLIDSTGTAVRKVEVAAVTLFDDTPDR